MTYKQYSAERFDWWYWEAMEGLAVLGIALAIIIPIVLGFGIKNKLAERRRIRAVLDE